ncbi:hypothetical protein KIL84_003266 [Mauremys mutica]|uniref:Uncharacterized protein n=1 Tax=Mauremys mutica TaxID=74926 RepID=A0A9D3WUV2_9SAUR|nr:hypothetical protein KIL84_003266 [Mauremys mutica]
MSGASRRQVGHCPPWPGVAESTLLRHPRAVPEDALGISWQKAVGWGTWESLCKGKGNQAPGSSWCCRQRSFSVAPCCCLCIIGNSLICCSLIGRTGRQCMQQSVRPSGVLVC